MCVRYSEVVFFIRLFVGIFEFGVTHRSCAQDDERSVFPYLVSLRLRVPPAWIESREDRQHRWQAAGSARLHLGRDRGDRRLDFRGPPGRLSPWPAARPAAGTSDTSPARYSRAGMNTACAAMQLTERGRHRSWRAVWTASRKMTGEQQGRSQGENGRATECELCCIGMLQRPGAEHLTSGPTAET